MTHAQATKKTYAGLFMVTLATLMYEILLTRIFSVTMWYHFAFMAISVTMFGMSVGAILVYAFPNYFTVERVKDLLALSSLGFAVSIVFSLLTHLSIPFAVHESIVGLYSIALTYAAVSLPFVFSGVCVCLALTKFPQQVSKLYAADLAGAALGCILLVYTLGCTDGPTAGIVVAFLASLGALIFTGETQLGRLRRVAFWTSLLLLAFAAIHTVLAAMQLPLLRLMWIKGALEERALYEKWNSFSYIRVDGNAYRLTKPFGWGLSPTFPPDRQVRQLMLTIDSSALTVLTAFHGDLSEVEHLKYDVTNLAHYIRGDAKVLVVGTGGGRDILSALAFKQKSVLGVEINQSIVDALNHEFGDFTGRLERIPGVSFVNDEARSYVARSNDRFDIIQISLIDTWAATAAGAFVLAENSLYTVEAWKIFLEHLTPNGILTVSRWYFRDSPAEVYRLVSLASAALGNLGVEDLRKHIVVIRRMQTWKGAAAPDGIGTILVSREAFSEKDLDTLEEVSHQMQFDLVLTPRFSLDSTFATIASGKDLDSFTASFPLNIAAPTDDSPFFFHMLRLRNAFSPEFWEQGITSLNFKAVFLLAALLVIVAGLTALCIFVPLTAATQKGTLRGAVPFFIFFASIGLGYMLVEISQMQRLMIFLGHPTYALSVVLFALLLSSGLGSYSTEKIDTNRSKGPGFVRLALLICLLVIFGMLTPYAITAFQGATTPFRILVAVAILLPLGFFMGMAFPLGMKLASTQSEAITPWLWGINGATSVCASVLAVAIALASGISNSFWTGFSCYLVGFLAFLAASRENRQSSEPR